jgi:hypothetical protein
MDPFTHIDVKWAILFFRVLSEARCIEFGADCAAFYLSHDLAIMKTNGNCIVRSLSLLLPWATLMRIKWEWCVCGRFVLH